MCQNLQVGVQGLKIIKPQAQKDIPSSVRTENGVEQFTEEVEGIDLEVGMILHEDNEDNEMVNWAVENLKFYIRQTVMGPWYLKYVVIDFFY